MPVTVRLGSPFRRQTNGQETVECGAANLPQLFRELETRFPGLTRHLCNEQGEPRPFLNVYVNDEDIRFLGGAGYNFSEGDEVLLIPSIAGGV
jgi:molybdopterin synthase sulfur carrier subunit